jgi:hypothetical protein
MLQALMLAPLCVLMSVSTGGKTNKSNIQRPEPSTLAECEWSMLYEVPTIADEPIDDTQTLGGGSATNYCQANPNSSGNTASISWIGSLTLSDNTFGLSCNGAAQIQNSWGLFVYGSNQFNAPFYNGFLCVSPFPPGIFKMQTQHLLNGNVVHRKSSHPSDFALFTPSSTWNFQFWFRDPGVGAGANMSDGLHVVFAP